MKNIYKLIFIGIVSFIAISANAIDVILVPKVIPYEKPDTANESVLKECDWNTTMPKYMEGESKGSIKVADQDFDSFNGKKLELTTIHLHTLGGGGWTGPKWLMLQGKLTDGGKLIGSFKVRRQTINGKMRACSTLTSLSEEITEDILEWLGDPKIDSKLGKAD